MSFISDLFGGGDKMELPEPTRVIPAPTRVEPAEVKPREKKNKRSLATQLELSEPLIKEEKLGT